jgi:hypothetical protein
LRKRRRNADEKDERARKRVYNDGRMHRIEQGIAEQMQQRKFIEEWWPRIKEICLICFLLDECWDDHCIESCAIFQRELSKVGVKDWKIKKIQTRYEYASCCYKCSRPGDMCPAAEFGMSQTCQDADVILPVVVMGWIMEKMDVKDIVEEVAGRKLKDVHDLFGCMMRKHYEQTLSYWGTKGFAAWTRIIYKNKERLKEELDEEMKEIEEEIDSDEDIYG